MLSYSKIFDEHTAKTIEEAQRFIDYSARAGFICEEDTLLAELNKFKQLASKADNTDTKPDISKLLTALSYCVNKISEQMAWIDVFTSKNPFISYKDTAFANRLRAIFFVLGKKISARFDKMLCIFLLLATLIPTFFYINEYRFYSITLKSIEELGHKEPEIQNALGLILSTARKIELNDEKTKQLNGHEFYSQESLDKNYSLLIEWRDKAQSIAKKIYEKYHQASESTSGFLSAAWQFFPRFLALEIPKDNTLISYMDRELKDSQKTRSEYQDVKGSFEGTIPPYVKTYQDQHKTENKAKASNPLAISLSNEKKLTTKNDINCDELKADFISSKGAKNMEHSLAWSQCLTRMLSMEKPLDQIKRVVAEKPFIITQLYRLNLFYLPATVGFLGAAVFLIYQGHSRKQHTNNGFMFLRFILGGVSAIIIAWFYLPSQVSIHDFSMSETKQFPFLFAFLAGFSTDSVLTILSNKLQSWSKTLSS